jgi:hypothetical protein
MKKPKISYFSKNVFKKPRNFYKSLTLSLKMSLKVELKASKLFKMPHIIGKSLHFSLNDLKQASDF